MPESQEPLHKIALRAKARYLARLENEIRGTKAYIPGTFRLTKQAQLIARRIESVRQDLINLTS